MSALVPPVSTALCARAARYLVGRTPSPEVLARCEEAIRQRIPAPSDPSDRALWAFVRRHPWSLGPLDAAAALLRPQGYLRSRLLVMAAVLEASPEGAADFLPVDGGLRTVARLPVLGLVAVLRTIAGLVLWPLAVRRWP